MKSRFLFIIALTFTLLTPIVFAESGITNTKETKDGFHEGTVEWISRCYMVTTTSSIIVRVIDYDMNKDPEKIEEFDVKIWSDFEDRMVDYTITETGNDTGIFESIVFFTSHDESPGQRIRAFGNSPLFDDSTVFAKYVDHTLPNADKMDVIATFVMSGLSVLERNGDGSISKIAYDPCVLEFFDKNIDWFDELDIFYPAPLKQIKSGLYPHEIKCKDNMELVFKATNSFPACVKPETKSKLIERGWGEPAPIPEPELQPHTTSEVNFDSEKYYEEFGFGSPLIYKDTSKPVLDNGNCDRYASWLTEYQKEKTDRYEDYSRYPPWGNQIFPLVDYCIANGNLVKTNVDGKIQWEFQVDNEN